MAKNNAINNSAESLTTDAFVSAGTTVTAGTGITATTGNIAASSGNVSASGTVTAGTTMTAGTGITSTTGNISATAGSVSAGTTVSSGTTMTAGTGLTVTTGNATLSSGLLAMPTTSSTVGQVTINSNRVLHTFGAAGGSGCTFVGTNSGNFTLTPASALRNFGGGGQTLAALTTGSDDTACGTNALNACTTGSGNTALGTGTLQSLTTGSNNVAIGRIGGSNGTLISLVTGSYNIAIGAGSGTQYNGAESSNILMQNSGTTGESNVMRLGTAGSGTGQVNQCFIAGINGISTSAAASVPYIASTGKLGTTAGGAITMNTGTQNLSISNDASATTVTLANGGAVKTLTMGSTTGASVTAIKYGTGDFSLASATGNVIVAQDTGEVTMPLQPAFLAYNSADDTNATGNAATPTIDFDTEIFDQNGDFATDTFTAPVTGRYQLQATVMLSDITVGNDAYLELVTTARTYRGNSINPTAAKANSGAIQLSISVLADMAATNTAFIRIVSTGEAGDTQTIDGQATNPITYFSGYLVA